MRVTWSGHEESVADATELRSLVARVRSAGRPEIVILEVSDGTWLTFGVGLAETVLGFGKVDAPSWHSLGDAEREDRLRLWSQGVLEDCYGETAIPESVGLAAAEWFVEHGLKPPSVIWEADWDE